MNKPDSARVRQWSFLFLSGSLLAGCVNQDREVALYRKQLDQLPGAKTPIPSDTGPLTLQQALRIAQETNESLKISGENYVQAIIAVERAYSGFEPTIGISASLSESQRLRGQRGPSHGFNIPATLSQNLFNGFRDVNSIAAADNTVEQQRLNLLNEQQAILLAVVQAYYDVLRNERSVTVLQNSLSVQEQRVRQSRFKKQYGNGTQLDIAQSQATASSTRVQLIQATTNVITFRALLTTLTGQDLTTRPLTDGFEPPDEVGLPLGSWLEQAFAHRQDLAATDSALKAAANEVDVAIGEYFPSVSLNVTDYLYKESNPIRQKLFAGLSANVPVFTAGLVQADVRAAYSRFRVAVLVRSQAQKQVAQDVRDGYANLENNREQIKELKTELEAARDAVVQAQLSFENGLATNLDVLTAQDTLLSNELQLSTQVYQEKVNYLNLLRTTGQLDMRIPGIINKSTITTRPATQTPETTTPNALSGAATQPTTTPDVDANMSQAQLLSPITQPTIEPPGELPTTAP